MMLNMINLASSTSQKNNDYLLMFNVFINFFRGCINILFSVMFIKVVIRL